MRYVGFDGVPERQITRMSRKLLFVELSGKRPYRRDLAAEGFVVDSAFSSTDAEAMMAMSRYDAVLVSASEPSMIATLPAAACPTGGRRPIIALVRVTTALEVALLEAGYSCLVPPETPFPEFLARLRVLLDRCAGFPIHYRLGPLGIDPVARRASLNGCSLDLRGLEFDLLLCLAEQQNCPVPPAVIEERLWAGCEGARSRLGVHILALRRRIDRNPRQPLLHTVRGVGYMLSAGRVGMDLRKALRMRL